MDALSAKGKVSPGSEVGTREPGGGGQIFRMTLCRCLTVLVEHEDSWALKSGFGAPGVPHQACGPWCPALETGS